MATCAAVGPSASALNAGVVGNMLWVTRTRTASIWSYAYLVSRPAPWPVISKAGPGSESITAEMLLGGVWGSLAGALVLAGPLPEISKAGPGSESDKLTAEMVLLGGATVVGSLAGAGVSIAIPKFILPMIGFGITGITKGSIASVIHSLIGNVTAGSFFALMQSAGAVGAISWTTFAGITFLGTAAVVTVAIAAVAVCYRWWPAR